MTFTTPGRQALAGVSLAIIALVLPLPAMAGITADAVWADWQARARDAGHALTAARSEAQDTGLVLHDVSWTDAAGDAKYQGQMSQIRMTEAGDAVRISLSDDIRMRLADSMLDDTASVPASPGEDDTLGLVTISHEALEIVARDVDGHISYETRAAGLGIGLSLEASGDLESGRLDIDLTDLETATATRKETGATSMFSRTSASRMTISGEVRGRDASAPFLMGFDAVLTDPSFRSDIEGPLDGFPDEEEIRRLGTVQGLLDSHLALSQAWSYTSAELSARVDGQKGTMSGIARAGEGAGSFRISDVGLHYAQGLDDLDVRVRNPGMVMPELAFRLDRANVVTDVPFPPLMSGSRNDLQTSRIDLAIENLDLDTSSWEVLDPTGLLPRGAMTLRLSGEADVAWDGAEKPAQTNGKSARRFHLREARIEGFSLEFAGASLLTAGTFRFDGQPGGTTGEIKLELDQVEPLLEGLEGLGALPPMQTSILRTMIETYTVPTDAGGRRSLLRIQNGKLTMDQDLLP